MGWKDYIDDSEEIRAIFDHKGFSHRVLGSTNKRNFYYKKRWNEEKFVTSQKAISHMEYGQWRVPWYAWFWLTLDFVSAASNLITNPSTLTIISFVPVAILLVVALVYRKFEYLISAVGSEKFHIISRKKKVAHKIIAFNRKLHHGKQVGLNASEEFVQGNYYDRLLNRFLFIITFEVSFFISLAFQLQIFFRDYFLPEFMAGLTP